MNQTIEVLECLELALKLKVGVSVIVQWKRIRPGTMRLWVRSLALLSGLRIQCCRELWYRSQTWLGAGVALSCAGNLHMLRIQIRKDRKTKSINQSINQGSQCAREMGRRESEERGCQRVLLDKVASLLLLNFKSQGVLHPSYKFSNTL